jgi:hypothetical protein
MNEGEGHGRRLGEFFIRIAEDEDLRSTYLNDPSKVLRDNELERYAEMIEAGEVAAIYEELYAAYGSGSVIFGTIVIGRPLPPPPQPW